MEVLPGLAKTVYILKSSGSILRSRLIKVRPPTSQKPHSAVVVMGRDLQLSTGARLLETSVILISPINNSSSHNQLKKVSKSHYFKKSFSAESTI